MLLSFLLFAVALGSRVHPEYTEALALPDDFSLVANADRTVKNPYFVALKLRNTDQLEAKLWAVSDPTNADYGKYWSLDYVRQLTSPTLKSVRRVQQWLLSQGIRSTLIGLQDMLAFDATPDQVSSALACDVQLYRHKLNSSVAVWRSLAPYSLPVDIAQLVDMVTGVHHFPIDVVHKPTFVARGSSGTVGPLDLRTRYNVTDFYSGQYTRALQAVAEFQGQYYLPSDLSQFFNEYYGSTYTPNVTVVGPNSGAAGTEAELDIQYIMGINPGAPTWFYSQSSNDFWSDLMAWIALLQKPNAPLVHSVSYGEQREHQNTETYKQRFNTEMQKLGVRGITIIFASGDSGTGCTLCVRFDPSFPATSPFVLSVGATTFSSYPVTPTTPEVAVSGFHSGGGFSWSFPRPSYQNKAVGAYLSQSNKPSGIHYHKQGRATPDVAACGWGFNVIVGGQSNIVGGTSASAPTFAAIVALLNQQQLLKGKPSLGFINPWLYQAWETPGAFYDVTSGDNGDSCCGSGFQCVTGYDPVTGLGTPNYPVLKSLLP